MRFHEETICPSREGGLGEDRHVFTLATRRATRGARELHGMRGVHDRRMTKASHDGERPHIDDEVLVAEGRAAIGLPNLGGLGAFELIHDEAHFKRREELALLHVDDFAGFGGGDEEISLTAHEGRHLQHVDDFADRFALVGSMDVREDVEAEIFFHHREQFEPRLHAGTTITREGGTVGLIVRAFKNNVQLRVLCGEGL